MGRVFDGGQRIGDATALLRDNGAARAPAITLPKGGDAIRGIGETFEANPVTGTGGLTIPLPLSPGRSGFGPQLTLSHDSGSGTGPFGFGWSLPLPAIARKTGKGLPQDRDAEEPDLYSLSGAEDLVPVLEAGGGRFEDDTTAPGHLIPRYRPRIEGLFAGIERSTNVATGEIHRRSITRDNVSTRYAKDNGSRLFDPADPRPASPTRVFRWLICESYKNKGNTLVCEYAAENADNVDRARANERNRVPPPLECGYSKATIQDQVFELDAETLKKPARKARRVSARARVLCA